MNSVQGQITEISTQGNLSLVTAAIHDTLLFKSIVIETADTVDYLQIGRSIKLLFKETEAIIATENTPVISLQNRIPATIESIDQGTLLSKIVLQSKVGTIVSIISSNAVTQLELQEGQTAIVMIKLNEVMLAAI